MSQQKPVSPRSGADGAGPPPPVVRGSVVKSPYAVKGAASPAPMAAATLKVDKPQLSRGSGAAPQVCVDVTGLHFIVSFFLTRFASACPSYIARSVWR